MTIACLAKISPMDRTTGNRVDIYVSSHNDRRVTGLNGVVWEPAMSEAPKLGISLWNGDFTDAVDPARATIPLNMTAISARTPGADAYMWKGAPVVLYAEAVGTAWPWTQRFTGKVSNISRRRQTLTLTAEVDQTAFAKQILGSTFAGTGGVEGGADLKNSIKPLILGWAQNVEPVLIDAVNSVYMFSGYGPIEGVTALYERGADFGAAAGDYASYAALVAATLAAGTWATCLASGLIRLGAPAYGVITGDVKGHKIGASTPRLPGSVISALATIAGVSSSLIETSTLTALDSDVTYNINLVLTDQATFGDVAKKIALSCNWQAGVSMLGKFFALKISLGAAPSLTLNAQGRAFPQVLESDEADVSLPYYKTVMGAARSWRVHSAAEVAFNTTAEATAAAALALANEKGKVTTGGPLPALADSNVGDTHIGDDGTIYERVNEGGILLGGFAVTLAGYRPQIGWTLAASQPLLAAGLSATWEAITGPAKPEDGADVTSAVTGLAEVEIASSYSGAITTALPKMQSYKLIRNGVDMTGSATWSVAVLSGTVTASIGMSTGQLSVTTSGGNLTNAELRISADLGGSIRVLDVRVTKIIGSAPVSSGSSATGSIAATVTTDSMIAVSDEISVTVGASGSVTLSANYSFDVGVYEYTGNQYARWYRWNGSAYVAIGSEVVSASSALNLAMYGDYYSSPGSGGCNLSDSGLTVGVIQKYRLYMRNDFGGYPRSVSGSCSAVTS